MARSGWFIPIVMMAVITGCAGRRNTPQAPAQGDALAAGNHVLMLRHGGRNREYIVHVPPRTAGAVPLLLALHGGGGNAAGFQTTAATLADLECW
jgi:poly(3-hydroxybutyrate) depolymerase